MYPRLARPPPGRRSPVVACRRRFQTRGSNGELASQPGSQVDGEEGGWRGAVTPLVLRVYLAPRFRPKKNFRNEFLGFLI